MVGGSVELGDSVLLWGPRGTERAGKSPTRNGPGTLKDKDTQRSVGSGVRCRDVKPSFIPSKFSIQPSTRTRLLRAGGSSGI